MSGQNRASYTAPAAACAADLLLALARSGQSASIGELARLIGQTKSLTYRVAKELEQRSYVTRQPDGKYWLGLTAIELGGAFSASVSPMASVRRVLRSVADDLGETVNLGVLRGESTLYVAREEGERSVLVVAHVGKLLPANCVALGKALLAEMSPEQVSELFKPHLDRNGELPKLTSLSIGTLPDLLEALEETRSRGFADEVGEVAAGRCCVAVAVRAGQGRCAAFGVSMDEDRYKSNAERVVERLMVAKEQIERDISGREALGTSEWWFLDPVDDQAIAGDEFGKSALR